MNENRNGVARVLFKVAAVKRILSGDRRNENRSVSVVNSGTHRERFKVSDIIAVFGVKNQRRP